MTHPADIQSILRQAAILVGKAEALGITLRITGKPMLPLAMGHQRTVIDAWPARIQPIGRQGAATPEHHERIAVQRAIATNQVMDALEAHSKPRTISDREWAARDPGLREGSTVRVLGVGEL